LYNQKTTTCNESGSGVPYLSTPYFQQAQVGQCMDQEINYWTGSLKWSLKVDSCTPGKVIRIQTYKTHGCIGNGELYQGIIYPDGKCISLDFSYRKATCLTSKQRVNRWSYTYYEKTQNPCAVGTEWKTDIQTPASQHAEVGQCLGHRVVGYKYSMMVEKCTPGQEIAVWEHPHPNLVCSGYRYQLSNITYKDGVCTLVDGSYRKVTCSVPPATTAVATTVATTVAATTVAPSTSLEVNGVASPMKLTSIILACYPVLMQLTRQPRLCGYR